MVKSSFDKVRRCRSANSSLFAKHYLINPFDYTALILVKGELTNETVNYNTETKAYQFEPEV